MLRMLALGALGYLGYKQYQKSQVDPNGVAFGEGQPVGSHRNAGPNAMGDKPQRKWTKTDEHVDESFPASDPPGNY